MARAEGNAAKRVVTTRPAPWRSWPEKARHARAIRFMETFCILPKGYGAGKPIVLAEFQKNWLEEILAPGVIAAAKEEPRGNGKSTELAGMGSWALFDEDDTGAPQVPVVATTLGQAIRSVYGVVVSMVEAHEELRERSLIYSGMGTQRIRTPFNNGEMFPISNDPDGLQGLDPSFAVCDEIGFMPIESWQSLLLASGKRPRSLTVGIGTPGFDRDSALWHMRQRSRSGDALPGFHFTEYAADDDCSVFDEEQWFKANPALAAGYMNIDALRTAVAMSPESHFRIFRLGQWVEGVESWLGSDGRKTWRALEDPWAMDAGAPTWVGVDVAQKHDTTAVGWCQKRPDGRRHHKTKIWTPRDDGKLDVADTMQFLRDLCAMYDVQGIAYDPRFFELAAAQLMDEGLPMVEYPQSLERMSAACGQALEAIKRGEWSHDGDEAFEDQILNAVPRYNERGFMLSKSKSKNKIDAAIAAILADSEAMATTDPELEPFFHFA